MSFESGLGNISKEKFSQTANKLLNKCYLIKKHEDTRLDYLYVLTNKTVFSEYFELLGYTIKIDETQGVIGLSCNNKSARVRLRKYESIVLLILRLLYAEARNKLSLVDKVVVTMEQIHEKYNLLDIKTKPILDKSTIQSTMTIFSKYNIIKKIDNDVSIFEARIIIYPSILFAVPNNNIDEIYTVTQDKLNKYAGGEDIYEDELEDTSD